MSWKIRTIRTPEMIACINSRRSEVKRAGGTLALRNGSLAIICWWVCVGFCVFFAGLKRQGQGRTLRDEGAADAGAAAFGALGVSLVQDDTDRRQNRDVQDGVELCGKIFRLFD